MTSSVDAPVSRQRIWFVSELFWPEETSTGYFLTRIAEDAAVLHDVHAVCSQPTYSARGTFAPRRETRNGVHIERVPSTILDKDVLVFRIINLLTFSASVFVRMLLRLRRGDVVVSVTNPPAVPYLVRLAAALRSARFVLLVHDVYPEVLVATGVAKPDSRYVALLNAASRRLYRSAERVVVLGRDMEALVRPKLSAAAGRAVIIPNWGDIDRVRPDADARATTRSRLGLDGRLVIEYMGNMGRTHDLRTLIRAAIELRADDRFHFLFIGWGAQRTWLEVEAASYELKNVTVLSPCAADDVGALLNAGDLAVISFRRGMAGVSVPSRLYNVMAAGRPVLALAEETSELARVVAEERIGWVLEPENVAAVTTLLHQVAAEHHSLDAMGQRARAVALERYSRTAAARAWNGLFADMTTSVAAPALSR